MKLDVHNSLQDPEVAIHSVCRKAARPKRISAAIMEAVRLTLIVPSTVVV